MGMTLIASMRAMVETIDFLLIRCCSLWLILSESGREVERGGAERPLNGICNSILYFFLLGDDS